MSNLTPPRVFISYSHDSDEHCQRILGLAQELRRNGIDALIDRFAPHPNEGWPRWMQRQIEDSDFVLAVCTAIYKRRFDGREDRKQGGGVNWEGFLTGQLIYNNQALNEKIIPIVFEDAAEEDIPLLLRGSTHYRLTASLEALLRRLTGQPEIVPEPLGQTPNLPPMLPPLEDAPVRSAGVDIKHDIDSTEVATRDRTRSILDLLCSALETKYREISHRYTPLEIREDLRLCPWEPRFIFRNPVKQEQAEEKAEQVTLDYVETVRSSHRLVVLGEPGCGKSTGLYAAAHKMAMSQSEGLTNRVPIIVNLNRYANFDSRHPRDLLVEMVLDECNRALHASELHVKAPTIDAYLRAGRLCVLFDGLNEVPASLRSKCVQSLIDFCDEFEQCNITVTSRKYMYNGELPFPAMEVLELGREDIVGFVERHANDGGITARAILNAVDKTKWHLFQNPLALHMMVRVFQETKAVPGNRALLIMSYIEIVMQNYFSNISRTGAVRVSKNDIKEGLTLISELMSVHGLCLPSDQIEQHIRATGQAPEKTSMLLAIALESGLLVNEGGATRFWHHSIQEYFFVLGFYSHWKGYVSKERVSRRYIRGVLKRPEKWETLSMAAGLMNEEQAEVFLEECVAKDEYLTAMVLNHCGGIKSALLTQKKIIKKTKTIALLSYWTGNILEWELVKRVLFLLLIAKQVFRIGGYAFQEPIGVSLPLLGPYITEDLLQFGVCLAVIVILRRLSDYLVFARFNTIIRALQHVGSTEARSELMKVFRKFSESARIELSYLTVIKRVVASNICTQSELFEGLKRGEEKLYCITTLASVGELAAMPVVCNMIHSERSKYVLEAAIDCVVSIANRFPPCKDDEQYKGALRHATLNRRIPIQFRLKAYAHFIEASGTAADISYPRLNWLERLREMLLSPRWVTYYVMAAVVVFVFTQTDMLAILSNLFSQREVGNFSGRLLITIVLLNVCIILVVYLSTKADQKLQQRVRSRADRKWVLLGEPTSGESRRVPAGQVITRAGEIKHEATGSTWRGSCVGGGIHKVASYGLRHGYTVDYLEADKVSLGLMLRSDKAKVQVNSIYRALSFLNVSVFVLVVFLLLNESEQVFTVAAVYLCVEAAHFAVWLCINPHVALVVRQVGQRAEVEGKVHLSDSRFPVSKVDEAHWVMAAVIADIAGNLESGSSSPVAQQ